MKPSAYDDRIVDFMEELVRFTVLTRPHVAQLTDRYSERKGDAAKLESRIRISAI
jgi:arsenic resistance protein ArsH